MDKDKELSAEAKAISGEPSPPDIVLAAASEQERDRLWELMVEHLADQFDRLIDHLGLTWERFRAIYVQTGEVRTIRRDGSVAGYLWIEKRARELHLHAIFVLPEHRGQGIGTAALRQLEAAFRCEVDVIELGVRADNVGAGVLYEREGFAVEDTMPDVGFVIMRKPLTEKAGCQDGGRYGAPGYTDGPTGSGDGGLAGYYGTEGGTMKRCAWAGDDPLMMAYHDEEWGTPVHDDRRLFGFLVLEGAQAGLSWSTILKKRQAYRAAFQGFDPQVVAGFHDDDRARLLADAGIVRNRRKIDAAIQNARVVLDVQDEFGSFDHYIWQFVGGAPIQNAWRTLEEIPAQTAESQAMAKALKARGFSFVGPTICYAFMQAVGMVNDHVVTCYRHAQLASTDV